MPFQQLLARNSQVIHTDIKQKKWKALMKWFEYVPKIMNDSSLVFKIISGLKTFFLTISIFFLRKAFILNLFCLKEEMQKKLALFAVYCSSASFFMSQSLSVYSSAGFEN